MADSLVSSHKYEIIKTVYTTHGAEGEEKQRLAVIQNTLGSLPLTNIATLDAITTHFTRLIELTSADEAYVTALSQSLSSSILRPRVESSLTQHERHAYRLVRDLFAHKEQIFGELKRASTLNSGRARAVSTDESQRRAFVEARNRAVIGAARSRPSSPAPSSRHRREVSTDGGNRFPIQTSPTSGSPRSSRYRPSSLEVPGGASSLDRDQKLDSEVETPRISGEPEPFTHHESEESTPATPTAGLEKSNSLTRKSQAGGGSTRFPRKGANLVRSAAGGPKRDSLSMGGSFEEERPAGVSLTDRPYDD